MTHQDTVVGFVPAAGASCTSIADLRRNIVGIDSPVPVLDGGTRPYVFLDNAASTPALRPVVQCIDDFLPWYSGVHRGTGFKSLLATEVFDAAHDVVLGGERWLCTSDGMTTYWYDDLTGERRAGTSDDLVAITRLCDALPEIDYLWPTLQAGDVDSGIMPLTMQSLRTVPGPVVPTWGMGKTKIGTPRLQSMRPASVISRSCCRGAMVQLVTEK